MAKKSLDIRKALEELDYSTSCEDRADGITTIIVGEFKKNSIRFNINDEIKIEIDPHCLTRLFTTNRECTIKITYNTLEIYESKMRFNNRSKLSDLMRSLKEQVEKSGFKGELFEGLVVEKLIIKY